MTDARPWSAPTDANTAVEQLNGMLKYATGLESEKTPRLNSGEFGISWSEAAARRIGGDELKRHTPHAYSAPHTRLLPPEGR